jgi:hypothetical protein
MVKFKRVVGSVTKMKFLFLTLLGVAVSGCAAEKIVNNDATPAESCSMVAEQTMQDGAMRGYNLGLQKAVYHDAYADCVKMNASHDIKAAINTRVGNG